MTKYRFDVLYSTPRMQEVSKFLQKCDVWVEGKEAGFRETWEFTTTKDHEVSYMKEKLLTFSPS